MATAVSEFIAEINEWANFEFPPEQITTWLRMAEYSLNQSLRCQEMVTVSEALLLEERVELPRGWQDIDFIRELNGGELLYMPRGDLYAVRPNNTSYSISGNYLIVNRPIDPTTGLAIEITYFDQIPALGNDETWLSTQYRWILLPAVATYAFAFNQENEQSAVMATSVSTGIEMVNGAYTKKKASGSKLISRTAPTRRRGF